MSKVIPGIYGFQGKHHFLSNFEYVDVGLDGVIYPSVEHAYQAAKTMDASTRRAIKNCGSPGKAKFIGKHLIIREDWCPEMAEQTMLGLLRQKFQHPKFKQMLLATKDLYIEETNWWKDIYWGVCDGKGQNRLGHLIMKVRQELNES